MTKPPEEPSGLIRGIGLWQATALNITLMVGAGVFATIPAMLGLLPGPYAILAWAGAEGWNPGVEENESLGLALAGATGVSGGSAHTVPALLRPDVGGRRLTDMTGVVSLGDGEIGGVACY